MDIFVARQPIFNKNKKLFAYELLFRDSMENYMPAGVDGDMATSSVLSTSFLTLGLEKVSGGKNVFINFTENLLLKRVPEILSPKLLVVEVLENVTPCREVLEVCVRLKKSGYQIALDDYVFKEAMAPFVKIVDIVKIDFMALSLADISDKIKNLPKNVTLLAEKVETWDEFNAARKMGFDLFQGYFFCKPEIVKGKDIPASSLTLLEVLAEVNKSAMSFEKIAPKIARDVSISYKLLKYMNSAYFRRPVKIKSIKDAIIFLGQDELKRFISVILMTNMAAMGTAQLAVSSCVRAKFCELLGDAASKYHEDQDELFTLGLFSLIDAILDQPMEVIMEMLPLSERIIDSLVRGEGDLVDLLDLVVHFEKGEWERVELISRILDIDTNELPVYYMKAIEWADAIPI